jgi:hypothetical protein
MKPFKTQFNPLMSIGRLVAIVILSRFLYIIASDPSSSGFSNDSNEVVKHVFLVLACIGLLSWSIFLFFERSKNFEIDAEKIIVHSLFTFSKTTWNKEDVYGFITPYIRGSGRYSISYRKIVIYVKKGKPLQLTQYSHFNFEETFKALRGCGYRYFASEYEASEFFDSLKKSDKV